MTSFDINVGAAAGGIQGCCAVILHTQTSTADCCGCNERDKKGKFLSPLVCEFSSWQHMNRLTQSSAELRACNILSWDAWNIAAFFPSTCELSLEDIVTRPLPRRRRSVSPSFEAWKYPFSVPFTFPSANQKPSKWLSYPGHSNVPVEERRKLLSS